MKHRNPVSVSALKNEWFGGMDLKDMGAAAGGLLAATMLPNYFIASPVSTLQKFGKVALALVSAAGAGFIFRNFDQSAGKAAVAGGVAGAVVQAITSFTTIDLGGGRGLSARRQLANAQVISPAADRSQETVQMITP